MFAELFRNGMRYIRGLTKERADLTNMTMSRDTRIVDLEGGWIPLSFKDNISTAAYFWD